MTVPRVQASPWTAPRRRAETLRERHAFAADVLALYLALLQVWERSWAAAREDRVPPEAVVGWAAERVLPNVMAATAQAGPAPLVDRLFPLVEDRRAVTDLLSAWLAGAELTPVERYLARAVLRGPLRAVDPGAACAADQSERGGRRCPSCGGPPQLSYRGDTGDRLVSGHRRLLCARCGEDWGFTGNACAGCAETAGAKRTFYAEQRDGPRVGRADHGGTALFGHLRVEACATCRRYLIDVDLGRDPRSVPEVDELAALPLALYAAERGLTKITPNVMEM